MRPVGKCVSLLSVLYLRVKLTWRYGAFDLIFSHKEAQKAQTSFPLIFELFVLLCG